MKRCMTICLSVLLLLIFSITASAVTELTISMTMDQREDGTLQVSLHDNLGGTVSNWPVSLEINGEVVAAQDTDYNGEVIFDYPIPEDAQEVCCTAIDGAFDEYTFKGCTMYLDGTVQPNDGEGEETEPTDETDSQTDNTQPGDETTTTTSAEGRLPQGGLVRPEDSLIIAPRTTAVNNNLVAIGVDVDNGVLNASQNAAVDFTTSARMWMDKDQYASLVADAQATLHLQLALNSDAGAKAILVNAKNADPKYASYDDASIKGYAMDMSVVYIDDAGRVSLEIPDGMYTIEMPVPAAMKTCDKIAIAVCTNDGLNSFVAVKPVGGVLTFTVQRLQTLAIVGFGEQGQALGSLAQTPSLIIVLIAVGVALVVAAILLLVFIVFRRKKAEEKAADPAENRDAAHLLIVPTANETIAEINVEDIAKKELAKAVLIDYDEQSSLDQEEREQYRAKPQVSDAALQNLQQISVPPAKQIGSEQLESIRRAVEAKKTPPQNETLTVDDLLEMLDNDLEDLNS